jgi:alpha-tubulin suppressor-like RCC1 family protein
MSLVWQQQATLASFIDTEYGQATFTAAKLEAITPKASPNAASVELAWTAPDADWATPEYSLSWSADASGSSPAAVPGVTGSAAVHQVGAGKPSAYSPAFTKVATGTAHACGISGGTVYCWGSSSTGALGLGDTKVARTPTAVTGGDLGTKTVTDVTAGGDFTCALASGRAYCWGLGTNGQLGNGSQSSSKTPRVVSNLTGVTVVSAGTAHACAVAGGKAYCWGQGASGQLGNGGSSQKEAPDAVRTDGLLAGRTVASVTAGGSHSCVVADGLAFCWGLNDKGQLGTGSNTAANTPVAVDTSGVLMGRSVSRLAAGGSHTCAIADSAAFCWGLGTSGQLGNSASTTSSSPVEVAKALQGSVVSVSAGAATSCAAAGGNAYCWGAGADNGLGNNGTGNANAPVLVNGALSGRTVTAVSAGTSFGCATSTGKPASCWGLGSSYQLGDDDNSRNPTPGDVTLTGLACPEGSVRLSDTTCSLVQGTSYSYRLGYSLGVWQAPDSKWVEVTTKTRNGVNPSATDASVPVTLEWKAAPEAGQASPEYTLQRSASNSGSNPSTLTVTGDRSFTDPGRLARTRKFTSVSAGDGHTCGIISGDLYCWGLNGNGQLGLGDTKARTVPTAVATLAGKTVTAVSAGSAHTCAIADGKVYCWGQGTSGQLGNGANNTQYTPVLVSSLSGTPTVLAAGGAHTCAISGGAAYCWGSNSDGQLGNNSTTNANTPVAVSTTGEMGSKTVTAIAAGGAHTCAVASDNRAYCWGQNTSYQLGSRLCTVLNLLCVLPIGMDLDRTTSVAVDTSGSMGANSVTAITAGTSHTCAIAGGTAYCWGLGTSGQLGNGANSTSYQSKTVSLSTVTAVSARTDSTCAIAGGAGYCWGVGSAGQLGNGTTSASSSSPVTVSAAGAMKEATVTSVAAGASHGCAVAGGSAYCWGSGDSGRLGTRAATDSTRPVVVTGDALCATGSVSLGDGTCSLATGTTYYYRVTFTLDGTTKTSGDWTGIKTSG